MVPVLAQELRKRMDDALPPGRIVPAHTDTEHFYTDTTDNETYPSVTAKTGILGKNYLKQWAVNLAIEHIDAQWETLSGSDDSFTFQRILAEAKVKHKEVFDRAAVWGTHGHDIVDRYVREWIAQGKRPTVDILDYSTNEDSPEGKCAALSAAKFFDDYTLFPIASEERVVSKKYRYGGTLDSLWLIGEVYKDREGDKKCNHEWWGKSKKMVRCSKCGRQETLKILLLDLKTSNFIMDRIEYSAQVASYGHCLKEMCGIKPQKHWILRLDKKQPLYQVGNIPQPHKMFKVFLHLNAIHNEMISKTDTVVPINKKNIITI